MSVEATETTTTAAEPPAGFPGEEPIALDMEADAEARALAMLTDPREPEDPAEPAVEEAPDDSGEVEPPTEPAEAAASAAPEPSPAPQVTEALAQVLSLKQEIEKERAELAKMREEAQGVMAQREELEPLLRARQLAKDSNLYEALEQMFPGVKPDEMVRAIAEGRGLDRPEDKLSALEKRMEEKFQGELRRIEELAQQREDAEVEHTITSTIGTLPEGGAEVAWSAEALEAAPLITAFGPRGLAAVRQLVDTERANGSRVTRESVRKALEATERDLVQNFLTVALKSEAVRTKYADQLRLILPGTSDRPPRVSSGHSLSNRATSDSSRRASTDDLTEEEREELALRQLRR